MKKTDKKNTEWTSMSKKDVDLGLDFDVIRKSLLLQKTNLGFSEVFWSRHETLVQKKAAEMLDENELAELIEMTRQIENANAQRLEAAYQLALLRNRNPKELMREMGILQENHGQ